MHIGIRNIERSDEDGVIRLKSVITKGINDDSTLDCMLLLISISISMPADAIVAAEMRASKSLNPSTALNQPPLDIVVLFMQVDGKCDQAADAFGALKIRNADVEHLGTESLAIEIDVDACEPEKGLIIAINTVVRSLESQGSVLIVLAGEDEDIGGVNGPQVLERHDTVLLQISHCLFHLGEFCRE